MTIKIIITHAIMIICAVITGLVFAAWLADIRL